MRLTLIALLIWASPSDVAAGSFVLFRARSPAGKAANRVLVRGLAFQLDANVVTPPRPLRWGANLPSVGELREETRAHGGQIGIVVAPGQDDLGARGLELRAVAASGSGAFEDSVWLKNRRAARALLRALTRRLSDWAAGELTAPASSSGEPAPTAEAPAQSSNGWAMTPAWASSATPAKPAVTSPAVTEPAVTKPTVDQTAEELPPPKRDRRAALLSGSVRASVGGLYFRDRIQTPVPDGNLDLGVPMTLYTTARADLTIREWLVVSASFRRYSGEIKHRVPGDDPDTPVEEPGVTPRKIGVTNLGGTVLGGAGMGYGAFNAWALAGLSIDSFTAEMQRTGTEESSERVVLVPSWKRIAPLVGVNLVLEQAASVRWELGATAILWASHHEKPETSGTSPGVLGVQGWLRFRYPISKLFFVEAEAQVETLRIRYSGAGTRVPLGATQPVQAAHENRLSLGTTVGVGAAF